MNLNCILFVGRYEAPAYFSPVENNFALDIPVYRDEIVVPREKLRKGLIEGVKLDVYFPGFPTFKNIPFTVRFQQISYSERTIYFSKSISFSLILSIVCVDSQLYYIKALKYSRILAKVWTWSWKFCLPRKRNHLWISWKNLWIKMYLCRGRIYSKPST